MTKKKKVTISVISLIAVLAIVIIFKGGKSIQKKKVAFTVKPIPVEVIKIINSDIKERIYLSGEIRGIQEVKIYSFVTGVLRRKLVTEGQKVFPGQPLFTVDQTQRGADILDHIIRSPIAGVVTDIGMDIGDQIVANQTAISRVVQTHFLKVKVFVGMLNIPYIKIGNKTLLKVASYPDKIFLGQVNKIAPTVDPNNRTVEVEISINNNENKLKSGMFAEVEIITSIEKNKILVPQESVLFEDNVNYVYKLDVKKKIVRRQNIRIGNNYSGKIHVIEGLEQGDYILTKGQYNVFSGTLVHISNFAAN